MRKLKLQVQMSLDGYIAGPNREMDWLTFNWDEEINRYVTELTESIGCIILGRKLAEGFIPHWAGVAADPENPEYAAGKIFTNTPKVVFSRTLEKSIWGNTTLAKGDLEEEIINLKKQDGKDIIAYGGADFVSDLIKNDLIDEFHLFINPVVLGQGMPIFKELENNQPLKLELSKVFPCGIVVLRYRKDT